jgi:phosphatidylglycerol:prolipoprotein diacylglycerol transferase
MGGVAIAGLAGGVVGAKLTEWGLGHWAAVSAHPALLFDPRYGGRTIIGGVVCGWIAVEIAKGRLGITRSTGDLFALALPAGEAIGRLGCYFNGCCYGTVSSVPWAILQHGAWRHPSQIYLSLSAGLILCILLFFQQRLPREGDLFRLYLVLFGLSRFCMEFFRERPTTIWGMSLAQGFCLELAVLGAMTLYTSMKRARPPIPSHGETNHVHF